MMDTYHENRRQKCKIAQSSLDVFDGVGIMLLKNGISIQEIMNYKLARC